MLLLRAQLVTSRPLTTVTLSLWTSQSGRQKLCVLDRNVHGQKLCDFADLDRAICDTDRPSTVNIGTLIYLSPVILDKWIPRAHYNWEFIAFVVHVTKMFTDFRSQRAEAWIKAQFIQIEEAWTLPHSNTYSCGLVSWELTNRSEFRFEGW